MSADKKSGVKRSVPRWVRGERTWYFGDEIVKHFKGPAENQIAILEAYQEQGWAKWIDDPLPRKPGRKAKNCLHSTINLLNGNQQNQRMHFLGDGTGKRIGWEEIK